MNVNHVMSSYYFLCNLLSCFNDWLVDDSTNRRMLMKLIVKYGVKAVGAEDGLEAVNMVLEDVKRYSLILMDNLMTKMVSTFVTNYLYSFVIIFFWFVARMEQRPRKYCDRTDLWIWLSASLETFWMMKCRNIWNPALIWSWRSLSNLPLWSCWFATFNCMAHYLAQVSILTLSTF